MISSVRGVKGEKMSKYDCTKTIDYAHELQRMCAANDDGRACSGCPLFGLGCSESKDITERYVSIVQKWSDEHPEKPKPKLTRKERAFVDSFMFLDGKSICYFCDARYLIMDDTEIWSGLSSRPACVRLADDMFQFVEKSMTLGELSDLEVEDNA